MAKKAKKIHVTYVGIQKGYGTVKDFIMVNLPSGTTVKYNPGRHEIVWNTVIRR